MRLTGERVCVWMGPLGILLFFIGMYPLAHFLPPVRPSLEADAVAAFYRDNSAGIRVGGMFLMVGAMLMLMFTTQVSMQLWRIGRGARIWAGCQLAAAVAELAFILLAAAFWCVASFRPGRSPDLVQLTSDMGWIMMVMPAPSAMLQVGAVGLGILADDRAEPLLPRWLGYYSIWTAILYTPGLLVPMFLHGPFAWNGLIAFWLVAVVFGLWFSVMLPSLLRAIAHEERETAPADA